MVNKKENLLNSGLYRPSGLESENQEKYLYLVKELKKRWNMKVMEIPIVIDVLGTIFKGFVRARKSWKLEDEQRPSKLQHC